MPRAPATPSLISFDIRREVPYFYNTFGLKFLACVVATCDQDLMAAPWWSAALAHTIACAPTTPQQSAQTSSPYHVQPRPTHPPTPSSSVTRFGTVASPCHDGRGFGAKLVAITAQVGGFGPHPLEHGGGPLCMPLCYWATQTTAATSALLEHGASGSTFRSYLTPISTAVRIQQAYQGYTANRTRAAVCLQNAYRAYMVSYARRNVLPLLPGSYKAILRSTSYSNKLASTMTGFYKENLSRMYRAWADRSFSELLEFTTFVESWSR
jgi:hypothetical protein